MLDAGVVDEFILGFDQGSLGDTRIYTGTVGHLDAQPHAGARRLLGIDRQEQTVTGPDYGNNVGTDRYGIPGTNGGNSAQRHPFFDTTGPGLHARHRLLRHHAQLDAALPHRAELHLQHRPRQGDDEARAALRRRRGEAQLNTTRPSSAAIGGVAAASPSATTSPRPPATSRPAGTRSAASCWAAVDRPRTSRTSDDRPRVADGRLHPGPLEVGQKLT